MYDCCLGSLDDQFHLYGYCPAAAAGSSQMVKKRKIQLRNSSRAGNMKSDTRLNEP